MTRLCIVTLLTYCLCRVYYQNARLDEAQAGIKVVRRNINNAGMQMMSVKASSS